MARFSEDHSSTLVALIALTMLAAVTAATADVVLPVNLQIKEQSAGDVLVQWQVPVRIPLQAMPEPMLPEHCAAKGDRTLVERPGNRLNSESYLCDGALGGASIGIRYPFYNATESTLLRVELETGEQYVHVLSPGEETWQLPEGSSGLRKDPWTNFRRAVMAGVDHFLQSWIHFAFVLAICLFADRGRALRLASWFFGGQLAAVAVVSISGIALDPILAECGVLIAVVLLAAQALREPLWRSNVVVLAAAAGLIHGLGIIGFAVPPPSFGNVEWLYLLLAVLGMDTVLVLASFVVSAIGVVLAKAVWSARLWRTISYALGVVGVAAGLTLVLISPADEADARPTGVGLPSLSAGPSSASVAGSRALSPQGLDVPVQTFLTIEPFETRLEVLVRLADVAERIGVATDGVLEIEDQGEVKAGVQGLITPAVLLTIDGTEVEPVIDRVDFLVVGSQGVLPRQEPVPEEIVEADIGVTYSYLTAITPSEIGLRWMSFINDDQMIPLTTTDPEVSQTSSLTKASPESVWVNQLVEDPVPTVESVAVQGTKYIIPMFSIPILLVSLFLFLSVVRSKRSKEALVWVRVCLTVALLVAPSARLTVDVEASANSAPSEEQARNILVALLPNIYRAFEFREESAVYDRLAVNVTGETLSDVYLEHRRALEMEERGGARARVEVVEVPEVRSVSARGQGAFDTEATWLVGGTVTHFGHRHFRQNKYDARISLVPVEGVWKISDIEVFDEERLK